METIEQKNDAANDETKEETTQRGRRSWVWDHFSLVKGATMTEYRYCKKKFRCDTRSNGTGGLINHLNHHCPTTPTFKEKRGRVGIDGKKQSILSYKPNVKGEGAIGDLTTYTFSQDKCRIALARMYIKDNRPFNIVDDEGFKELVLELCPLFKMPSRWTLAKESLGIYVDEAVILKKNLKGQMLSLTTDKWTSVQNVNYMCLAGHWIDDSWELKKKILNFCRIENHKGSTIGKLVYSCLQNWGIERFFTVTVDNASSNDGAIKFLKTMLSGLDEVSDCKFLHLRYCAHILNLVVRDGLEEQHVSFVKIRNAVRYVRSSPARETKFRECVEREKIACTKKVYLDVETRWNTTYIMLETAYADAFGRLQSLDYNYKEYFQADFDMRSRIQGSEREKRKEIWDLLPRVIGRMPEIL